MASENQPEDQLQQIQDELKYAERLISSAKARVEGFEILVTALNESFNANNTHDLAGLNKLSTALSTIFPRDEKNDDLENDIKFLVGTLESTYFRLNEISKGEMQSQNNYLKLELELKLLEYQANSLELHSRFYQMKTIATGLHVSVIRKILELGKLNLN